MFQKLKFLTHIFLLTVFILCQHCSSPKKEQSAQDLEEAEGLVSISNKFIKIVFNSAAGTYDVISVVDNEKRISNAKFEAAGISSDDGNLKFTWSTDKFTDELGNGNMLKIEGKSPEGISILAGFTLYTDQKYLVLKAGIKNETIDGLQLKEFSPLSGGKVFEGYNIEENLNLLDGNGGGEMTAVRKKSFLHSRNNLLLTFGNPQKFRSMVAGGLTYHEFEKFAEFGSRIERRQQLTEQAGEGTTLISYLDLGKEKEDGIKGAPFLKLKKGHKYHFSTAMYEESGTIAYHSKEVVINVSNLKPDKKYSIGFSWVDDGNKRTQSVAVSDSSGGNRTQLLQKQALPLTSIETGPEEFYFNLPSSAYKDGEALVHFSIDNKPNAVLSEMWLYEGELNPAQEGKPVKYKKDEEFESNNEIQIYAKDPVGKLVDAGSTYFPNEWFYVDVLTDNPYVALEQYAFRLRDAQKIHLNYYTFPTVCLWYAMHWNYGDGPAINDSPGAVAEMDRIAKSGFLKYHTAAVRLVPDNYDENNEQGWWDDKHWQMYGSGTTSNEVKVKPGHYKPPYETSKKWAQAILDRGGIPLTYFQTAKRSQDYAETFPEHMLFNEANAPIPNDDWTMKGKAGYDFTDKNFLQHMKEVYQNLQEAGVKGLMFDYPDTGWAEFGGMDDQYSTTAYAYRKIFELAYKGLGEESYIHERNLDRGSEITLGVVASQRTWGDTDLMNPEMVSYSGLRWYKNRVVVSYDMDSKNLDKARKQSRDALRQMLTMTYVASGRLLMGNSFARLTTQDIYDLSRTFPYHTQAQSARPVDAFTSRYPKIYDFKVNDRWHLLTFYNYEDKPSSLGLKLSALTNFGGIALDPAKKYHVFDFWNNQYIGSVSGDSKFEQQLRPNEARMMAIHEVAANPQFISTNRHIMQGYIDLEKVEWSGSSLKGIAKVIGGEPFKVIIAANGFKVGQVNGDAEASFKITERKEKGIYELIINSPTNKSISWEINFSR